MSNLPINQVICGNNIEVMAEFPDNSIDLVITSPPYDNLRDYEGFDFSFKDIALGLFRVIKIGGVLIWVVGDATIKGSETGTSFKQALYFKKIGFNLHDTMIYMKSSFAHPSINRYHQVFEYMFVLSKGPPKTFNPLIDRLNTYSRGGGGNYRQKNGIMTIGKKGGVLLNKFGMRFNIWKYKVGGGHSAKSKIAYQHPAIFPEQLVVDHIKSWSNEGNLILDPMCGSGTTCIAAKNLNRNYIGIDISEKYCKIAKERLKTLFD